MAQNIQYKKSIIDTLIELLKTEEYSTFFRHFYYGDPGDIPVSNYPCVCVELQKTQITHGPTGMDKIVQTVEIKLMYNKKDDFGKDPNEIHGQRKLEEYAQGVDPDTDQYDEKTVAGLLRKNFTLGNLVTDQDMIIEYGVSPGLPVWQLKPE
jgi:hypothetical protein